MVEINKEKNSGGGRGLLKRKNNNCLQMHIAFSIQNVGRNVEKNRNFLKVSKYLIDLLKWKCIFL